MQELISYFQGINSLHWGSNWYQWFFYFGVILIIILEKDKIKKSIFGLSPVLFLLGIFNPIFYKAIHLIWKNPNAYYARMFSFVPLLFCIAFGFMQIIKRIKWEWLKLIAVCAISSLIIIGGDNFYSSPWMSRADNSEKIPEGLTEVVEILSKEDRVLNVAVPDPLNVYIRQIDAHLITPYGRYMNGLGSAISQNNIDVPYVMTQAGEQAVDYIVINNSTESKEIFGDYGYVPQAETEKYLIYAVTNVPFIQRQYNKLRQIIAEMTCDQDGNPVENAKGYATIVYEYDGEGNRTKETYLDKEGKRVEIIDGYSSIKREYRLISNLLESISYLDVEDKAILYDGRYETRYRYDDSKNVIQESYYDQNGNPVILADDTYASRMILRDSQGRKIGEQYFDTKGNNTVCSIGYASYILERDSTGNIIKESYFGTNGQPIRISAGYAGIRRTFTEEGKKKAEIYIDETDNPTICNAGYAQVRWDYDAINNTVLESYWDENGSPVRCTDGYASILRIYDDAGDIQERRFFDTNGDQLF